MKPSLCLLALSLLLPVAVRGQGGDHGEHLRRIIDRSQNDLTAAIQIAQGSKDSERYRHAKRELSDLDREVSRGHFDEAKLNNCIGALNDILDHSSLEHGARNAISEDAEDLKMIRNERQH
jgi:hypothetical protein